MPRVASKLSTNKSGGRTARKRIPSDVQNQYQQQYGVRWEARLSLPPGLSDTQARAQYREWLSEIEQRIANIRSAYSGSAQSLTPKQARALSGEWYRWFIDQHETNPQPADHWEHLRSEIGDEIAVAVRQSASGNGEHVDRDDIDGLWNAFPAAREAIRPMLADWCETSRFLASRNLSLDTASRDLFVDGLYRDFAAALELLIRQAQGDYSPDVYPTQFPEFCATPGSGLTPWRLFELWVERKKPATATVDRWRAVFLRMEEEFGTRSAASISVDEAQKWLNGLVDEKRSAATVEDVWRSAARTLYKWGVGERLLSNNPFSEFRVTVPKHTKRRETKAFRDDEIQTILSATLGITDTSRVSNAAKRWVPWICAYTGARAGEITQLRGIDIETHSGLPVMKISPDAGTVKTNQTRLLPIHEHLVVQGFLEFAKSCGQGPLFYNALTKDDVANDATNPPKPRHIKARELVAGWVREIGITDPEVQPNHAWRHTFKQRADRCGINERMSDYITGHAPASVGRSYGEPTVQDMAKALKQFPRYELKNG